MPHHERVTLSGVVEHVFAHRFTLVAGDTVHLADLGPKGAAAFAVEPGLSVRLEGELRPSEIKVSRIATSVGRYVEIDHPKPHHGPKAKGAGPHHGPDTLEVTQLLEAARHEGWTVTEDVERKPKHVELLGRRNGGDWMELHMAFDGTIYKEKPALSEKWRLPDGNSK